MKHYFLLAAALGILAFSSCSSEPGKTTTPETKDTVVRTENFEKGKVIEKVNVLSDATQSYALYLPSTYSTDKKYTTLYIFDAHAEGKLPVTMYKELAEQYDFILIGSNNSKNGTPWEEIQKIGNNLFSDSYERLAVDPSRMYLMGFSGGARVANALCINNGGISGVICCGAAGPAVNTPDPRTNYTFLGICGNEDFNYIEMRKYDMVDLAGRPVKHAFIEFDGKHEWPKAEIMKEGFLWTRLGSMRKKTTPKDDAFIKNEIAAYSEQIKTAQQNKNTPEVYDLVRRTINFFDGLTDLKEFYAIYEPLKNNAEVDAALKRESVVWEKEQELKSFYGEALQTKNTAWWRQEAANLNKKSSKADEMLMNKRLLDFLSLVAYLETNNAIKQQNLPAAKMFSEIYVIVDPTNKEAHYLAAVLFAAEGKNAEAIRSLGEAAKNGFTDTARIEGERFFDALRTSEGFKTLVDKMRTTGQS